MTILGIFINWKRLHKDLSIASNILQGISTNINLFDTVSTKFHMILLHNIIKTRFLFFIFLYALQTLEMGSTRTLAYMGYKIKLAFKNIDGNI